MAASPASRRAKRGRTGKRKYRSKAQVAHNACRICTANVIALGAYASAQAPQPPPNPGSALATALLSLLIAWFTRGIDCGRQ